MEEAAEYQFKFNYLFGNTGTKQLYYDFQLWYCVRENYWGCVNPNCNSFISTNGDKLKSPSKALPLHNHDCKLT